MNIFPKGMHRRRSEHGTRMGIDNHLQDDLDHAEYDAQTDLALPSHPHLESGTVFTPFAGELVPDHTHPGYDLERDIAS